MKMFLVVFVLGLLIGILVGDAIRKKGTAVGRFYLKPYDEDDTGFYNVYVDIIPNQDLLHKNYILLKKEEMSQDLKNSLKKHGL